MSRLSRLKKLFGTYPLLDYYTALFAPSSIVLSAYLLEKVFYEISPYVDPNGLDGLFYFSIHTVSIFLVLGFGGVLFLRGLQFVRNYLRIPWKMVTPPFHIRQKDESDEVNHEIIDKSLIFSVTGIGSGLFLASVFPLFAFVPWRNGTAQISNYNKIAPEILIPELISQLPIISDLIVLGGYISSPDQFGYLLVGFVTVPFIIGFWNLTHLCLNRQYIVDEIDQDSAWVNLLFTWLPNIGFLLFLATVWRFGVPLVS